MPTLTNKTRAGPTYTLQPQHTRSALCSVRRCHSSKLASLLGPSPRPRFKSSSLGLQSRWHRQPRKGWRPTAVALEQDSVPLGRQSSRSSCGGAFPRHWLRSASQGQRRCCCWEGPGQRRSPSRSGRAGEAAAAAGGHGGRPQVAAAGDAHRQKAATGGEAEGRVRVATPGGGGAGCCICFFGFRVGRSSTLCICSFCRRARSLPCCCCLAAIATHRCVWGRSWASSRWVKHSAEHGRSVHGAFLLLHVVRTSPPSAAVSAFSTCCMHTFQLCGAVCYCFPPVPVSCRWRSSPAASRSERRCGQGRQWGEAKESRMRVLAQHAWPPHGHGERCESHRHAGAHACEAWLEPTPKAQTTCVPGFRARSAPPCAVSCTEAAHYLQPELHCPPSLPSTLGPSPLACTWSPPRLTR